MLGDQLLAPHMPTESYSHPERNMNTAVSTKGPGSSSVGCYVGTGSDALDGNIVLEVPYLHPTTPPLMAL